MKKSIRNFALAVAALILTCSFTIVPTSQNTETLSIEESIVGGAYLVFAGKKGGGEITSDAIIGERKLEVDGCARGSRIYQFTLRITTGGETTTFRADSNMLDDSMVKKLSGLTKGDEFEFKNLKAYLPNGKDKVDVHGWKYTVV